MGIPDPSSLREVSFNQVYDMNLEKGGKEQLINLPRCRFQINPETHQITVKLVGNDKNTFIKVYNFDKDLKMDQVVDFLSKAFHERTDQATIEKEAHPILNHLRDPQVLSALGFGFLDDIIDLSTFDPKIYLSMTKEQLTTFVRDYQKSPDTAMKALLNQVVLKLLNRSDTFEDHNSLKDLLQIADFSKFSKEQLIRFKSQMNKYGLIPLLTYKQAYALESRAYELKILKWDPLITPEERFMRANELCDHPKLLKKEDLHLFPEFYKVLSIKIKELSKKDDYDKFKLFFDKLSPDQQQLLKQWGQTEFEREGVVEGLFAGVNQVSNDDFDNIQKYISRYFSI